MSWKSIPGHCNYTDVYDDAIAAAQEGDTLVEVGVLYGRSLAYLARRAIDSGKELNVYGVDNWGSAARRVFRDYMRRYAPEEFAYVDTIQCTSVDGAVLFDDHSCSFVFIDAGHSYGDVCADIEAWWPKVRPGGVIAGHDYSERDWPGVWRAVRERFGEIEPVGEARYCWSVTKEGGR